MNAVCTFCTRFVSVHSICADLPPHKLLSVRHYTMPCAHQNLRACVLIKELQTVHGWTKNKTMPKFQLGRFLWKARVTKMVWWQRAWKQRNNWLDVHFNCTKISKVTIFLFKPLHRRLATNYFLSKMGTFYWIKERNWNTFILAATKSCSRKLSFRVTQG